MLSGYDADLAVVAGDEADFFLIRGYDRRRAPDRRRSQRRRARRRRRRRAQQRRRARLLTAGSLALAICAAAVVLVSTQSLTTTRPAARAARVRPQPPAHPRAKPAGRWLVPAAGAPLTVAAENRLPGTAAWRLGPGTAGPGSLAVYVSDQSAHPGGRERVYVSDPRARFARVLIFRMGWYGGAGGRLVFRGDRTPVGLQPPCRHDGATGLTECDWHPTLSLRLPRELASGVYVVKVEDDRRAERDSIFVVEGRRPAPMVAQIPLATYEAYNNWGGDSLYPGYGEVRATGTRQGVEVSFDRPYDSATGAGQFFKGDVAMVTFLERRAYPLSYTTSMSVDMAPRRLLGRRVVVDVGHAEYWSARAARAFASAIAHRTNVAFMSSDTLAWRIRYLPATDASSERGRPDHRFVAYKEHATLDPDRADPTGAFPDGGASITGSAFESCITPSTPASGGARPRYRYYSWTPAPALSPRWLFRGTGLTPATPVRGIVGYELDATTATTPPGTLVVGSGVAPCRGTLRFGAADTTLYTAPSGALVFASGTLGWQFGLEALPGVSPDVPRRPDPRLRRLTENLLARMLRSPPPAASR